MSSRSSRVRPALVITTAILVASGARPARADRTAQANVAVFVEAGARGSHEQDTLLIAMQDALEEDLRLEVVDKDRRLGERAGVLGADVASEALGLLASGEALLRKNKASTALSRLAAAERQLVKVLGYVSKKDLARAQFLLGAAHAMVGNEQPAKDTFQRLLIWRPRFVADTDFAPEKVLPLWESVKALVDQRAKGSLSIATDPAGALAYVDGVFIGFTPTSASELIAGTHYVTLRKGGHQRMVQTVKVSAVEPRELDVELTPSRGYSRVVELAGQVQRRLGQETAPPAIDELRAILDIDHAVFLRASKTSFDAYLYDVHKRTLLAKASVEPGDPDDVLAELARALYADVTFGDRPDIVETAPVAVKQEKRSIVSRWWFWAGVSAIVVAAALPFVLSGGGDESVSCPPGEVCGAVLLRF